MKTLVLSDIHGNWPALEAILEHEEEFNRCLFLGDVVDYGPFPKECIAFLRAHMTVGVLGNHDNALAYDTDCGCRDDFKRLSEETRFWHRTLLDTDEIDFLKSFPATQRIDIDGKEILLAHASPDGDLFRYVTEDQVDHAIAGVFADIILLGHTHVQFMKQLGPITIANPGSVGLARDGGHACYATIIDGYLHLHRISYEVEKTVAALERSPISLSSKRGLVSVLRGEPLSGQATL